ncbi:hypothetical protein KC19_11G157300 [Ceratodon purpureus]|uniref:F-box domain-containing protein n=1 Tax=Ceratodon purpureus TaxID=3225 RepID=A0A8T0GGN7_CERPU|nr:hypothetical protein KC19_11G157300 [Ceratodon purpureus]
MRQILKDDELKRCVGHVPLCRIQASDGIRAALWSRLPSKIVDHMLSFLSLLGFCRYRSVCKGWNYLICALEFGALCAQNTKKDVISSIVMHWLLELKKLSDSV